MRIRLVLAALVLAAPFAAGGAEPSLLLGAEQSSILAGDNPEYLRGEGDVLYVDDRAGRWYWVDLNEGCLSTTPRIRSLNFAGRSSSQRIDRFTRVQIEGNDERRVTCAITSIRRIEFS